MRNHVEETLDGRRKRFLSAASSVALAAIFFAGMSATSLIRQSAAGQVPLAKSPTVPKWQLDAGGKMEFDAASIKQNLSHDPAHTNVGLSGFDEGSPNGGFLSAVDFPLSVYIMFAYKLTPYQMQSLQSQLPKWAATDNFDVEARTQGSPTRDQMRLMMQSLLADRFKLAVHTEARQLPELAVVLEKPGKTGPRLVSLPNDVPCAIASPASPGAPPPPGKYDGWFTPCGGGGLLFVGGRVHFGSENITTKQLAAMLSVASFGALDQTRPIFDQTGLTGKFDFTIEYTPDPNGPARNRPNFQPDESGPTFLEALKDQLGLKLVSQTGPVDVLVIDHIEEPSPN